MRGSLQGVFFGSTGTSEAFGIPSGIFGELGVPSGIFWELGEPSGIFGELGDPSGIFGEHVGDPGAQVQYGAHSQAQKYTK